MVALIEQTLHVESREALQSTWIEWRAAEPDASATAPRQNTRHRQQGTTEWKTLDCFKTFAAMCRTNNEWPRPETMLLSQLFLSCAPLVQIADGMFRRVQTDFPLAAQTPLLMRQPKSSSNGASFAPVPFNRGTGIPPLHNSYVIDRVCECAYSRSTPDKKSPGTDRTRSTSETLVRKNTSPA